MFEQIYQWNLKPIKLFPIHFNKKIIPTINPADKYPMTIVSKAMKTSGLDVPPLYDLAVVGISTV